MVNVWISMFPCLVYYSHNETRYVRYVETFFKMEKVNPLNRRPDPGLVRFSFWVGMGFGSASNRTNQWLSHRTGWTVRFSMNRSTCGSTKTPLGFAALGPKSSQSPTHQAAHLSRSPLSSFPFPSVSRLFMELIKFVSFRYGMWDLSIKKNKCLHCEDLNLRSKV